MMKLSDIKKIDLVEFLTTNYGLQFEERGLKRFCSSPFNRHDKTPSFCVFTNTNSFYDFSVGFGGTIIDFVKNKEGVGLLETINLIKNNNPDNYSKVDLEIQSAPKPPIPFRITDHLTASLSEKAQIRRYALSRKIKHHFVCGFFYERIDSDFIRRLAMGFVLYDDLNNITGIKLRNISNSGDRFRLRGNLGVYRLDYILEDSFQEPAIYVIEGESNANSLWEFLKLSNRSSVVLCYGASTTPPKNLPIDLQHIEKRNLIIDRDENKLSKEQYEEKLEHYKHLNCEIVTLHLNRGEDINQLFILNKFNILNTLL